MSNGNNVLVRLKGINRVVRRNSRGVTVAVYYYHRATGTPLVGEPGTPEFSASFGAAERMRLGDDSGTVSELIRKFAGPLAGKGTAEAEQRASPDFRNLSESSKTEYRRKLRVVDAKWGSVPVGATQARAFRNDVLKWRNEKAIKYPREADNLVAALARVLSHAVEYGEIEKNVLDTFPRAYTVDRSDMIWLREHVDAFMQVASVEMSRALMLAMHTGQRQGDLRRLPWSAYDGKRITLRQGKSKKPIAVLCTKALKRTLDGMPRTSPLILTTKSGLAWKKRYFSEQWLKATKAAGIVDLHFHDLRGTAVTMLAEAGCTIPEIASITGHSMKRVNDILAAYMAMTQGLADAAILKLERHTRRLQKGA